MNIGRAIFVCGQNAARKTHHNRRGLATATGSTPAIQGLIRVGHAAGVKSESRVDGVNIAIPLENPMASGLPGLPAVSGAGPPAAGEGASNLARCWFVRRAGSTVHSVQPNRTRNT